METNQMRRARLFILNLPQQRNQFLILVSVWHRLKADRKLWEIYSGKRQDFRMIWLECVDSGKTLAQCSSILRLLRAMKGLRFYLTHNQHVMLPVSWLPAEYMRIRNGEQKTLLLLFQQPAWAIWYVHWLELVYPMWLVREVCLAFFAWS